MLIFILTGEIPVSAGSGEGSLQELNDYDNDEHILGFRPNACMDKVEKSAPLITFFAGYSGIARLVRKSGGNCDLCN